LFAGSLGELIGIEKLPAKRGPDDELRLQFEALRQFDEEERKTALEVLEGLILKHQAKRMVQRTQSQAATNSTAKAAQGRD